MVQKQNKWIAPALAISLAVGGFAGITKQNMVEAKGMDASAISKVPSKAGTTKPVYLPKWQGISVDDLEFFPRKGFIRYSQKSGLEYYMRVYSSLGVYTTGFRPLDTKNTKAAMVPRLLKSLHTNQFRIQNRTIVGRDKNETFFNIMIGDRGTRPNLKDTEFYQLLVNDNFKKENTYLLRCNFYALSSVHTALTGYLKDGKPDYAENVWSGYGNFYNPDFTVQKVASINRIINVLVAMEGFNKDDAIKFKQIILEHSQRADVEGKLYVVDFMFNNKKYNIKAANNSMQLILTKF